MNTLKEWIEEEQRKIKPSDYVLFAPRVVLDDNIFSTLGAIPAYLRDLVVIREKLSRKLIAISAVSDRELSAREGFDFMHHLSILEKIESMLDQTLVNLFPHVQEQIIVASGFLALRYKGTGDDDIFESAKVIPRMREDSESFFPHELN